MPVHDERENTIRREGDKWLLISDTGKVLGTHDTRSGAEAQERAIKSRESMNTWKELPQVRAIFKAKPELEAKYKDFALPETFSVPGVEIFSAGKWNGDVYTVADLDKMVAAFPKTKDRLKPFLKLGHSEKQTLLSRDELPSAGFIDNLRRIGSKLVADFVSVPKKIKELLDAKAYSRVSSEIFVNFKSDGETFPFALKAVALLGGETPAVHNLDDVIQLFAAQGGEARAYADDEAETKTYDVARESMTKEETNMAEKAELEKALAAKDEEIAKLKAEVAEFRGDKGLEDELDKLRKKNKELTEKLAEAQKKIGKFQKEKKNAAIEKKVDDLIASGKMAPAKKESVVAALKNIDDTDKTFAVGDKEMTVEELIFSAIEPVKLPTEEKSEKGEKPVKDAEGTVNMSLAQKAQKYAEENKVSYKDALVTLAQESEQKSK